MTLPRSPRLVRLIPRKVVLALVALVLFGGVAAAAAPSASAQSPWINIIYGSLNNGYYGNGYFGGYGAYGGYNGLYGNGLYGYNGLYGGYGYNGLYGGYNYLGGYTYPTTYSTTGYVTSSPPLTYQQPNPTGAGVSVGVSWQLCTTPGGTGPIWVPLGHSTAGLLC